MSTRKEQENVIFFFGSGAKSGDAACLSNFYELAPFVDERGRAFLTSEHCYMAAKAEEFGDAATLAAIMAAPTPQKAKKYGRQVVGFDEAIWNAVARERMTHACLLKFRQNRKIRRFLLSTGDALLAEASPFDPIWGIGLSASEAASTPRKEWPGSNWLGEVLMRVREQLRREAES